MEISHIAINYLLYLSHILDVTQIDVLLLICTINTLQILYLSLLACAYKISIKIFIKSNICNSYVILLILPHVVVQEINYYKCCNFKSLHTFSDRSIIICYYVLFFIYKLIYYIIIVLCTLFYVESSIIFNIWIRSFFAYRYLTYLFLMRVIIQLKYGKSVNILCTYIN